MAGEWATLHRVQLQKHAPAGRLMGYGEQLHWRGSGGPFAPTEAVRTPAAGSAQQPLCWEDSCLELAGWQCTSGKGKLGGTMEQLCFLKLIEQLCYQKGLKKGKLCFLKLIEQLCYQKGSCAFKS